MDADKFLQELQGVATQKELAEVQVLTQAERQNLVAYNKDPTATNKRNWDAAKKGRVALIEQLEEKYAADIKQKASEAALPSTFENTRQVHIYLQEQGWKCAYNTVAKDIKSGKLTARRGGGFARQTVDQYAMTHLVRRVDADPSKDAPWADPDETAPTGAAERRLSADADIKERQAKLIDRKLAAMERKLIPRELYEKDLAARLALFSNSIDVWAQSSASDLAGLLGADAGPVAEIIELVGGDPDKASALSAWFLAREPEIVELVIKAKQDWLRAYALHRVQVVEIEEYIQE
jgi:hypothetical protein